MKAKSTCKMIPKVDQLLELQFLLSIKRPNLTYGPEYTCVLDICLLPKKGYSYIEAQSLHLFIKHTHMSSTF